MSTILACARHYGAETWLRPRHTATDDAPDLTWLTLFVDSGRVGPQETFVLRRLTSPFITPDTITRAFHDFLMVPAATAMRAMRRVSEHPNKMWQRQGLWMVPALEGAMVYTKGLTGIESWSMPTQQLATVYAQTAGLEVLKAQTIRIGSLTGHRVLPCILEGPEALDLDTLHDWWVADRLVAEGGAVLPDVVQDPWVAA